MGDLRGLIDAVENGDRWDNNALYRLLGVGNAVIANGAYLGSLDAAKALHEALLPGWYWSLAEDDDYGFCCKVFFKRLYNEYSIVASRAWLLAILRALEAEGKA